MVLLHVYVNSACKFGGQLEYKTVTILKRQHFATEPSGRGGIFSTCSAAADKALQRLNPWFVSVAGVVLVQEVTSASTRY